MAGPLYINSAGLLEEVDAAREAEALSLGWVPASAEQAKDYFLAQKYGSTGQAALAGLESFGSMLSFGLSTHAQVAMGADPEAIAAREKANPLASGAGSGLGIALPLLLTGGSSTAAQAARATAPSLLARAGQATAKAAMRELPAGASLAQRLTAKGLAAAAGGAVEGAGYEVGQLVHEAALGDPALTAESALARVGVAAGAFGALSGAGGVLGELLREAGGTAGKSSVGDKLRSWLGEFEGERGLKAAGGVQSDIARARKQMGREELNALGREMGELGLVSPLSTPAQTLQRADALMDRAGRTMGEVLDSVDDIARAEGTTMGGGYTALARARKEILEPLRRDPLQREAAARFAGDLDAFEPLFAEGATLKQLHEMRKSVDRALYGMRGTMDPYATAYKQALHDFRGLVSEGIEAGVTKSGVPLDIWKTANREYQVAARAAEFAERGIDRAAGNNLVSPTELLSTLAGGLGGGPTGGLAGGLATAALRRHGSGALNWLARGLRGVLEGEEGALIANGTAAAIRAERQAAKVGLTVAEEAAASTETAAALSVLARAKRALAEEVDSALKGILNATPGAIGRTGAAEASLGAADAVKARQMAAEPGLLMDGLSRQTDDLHPHAPRVAQAAAVTGARAAAFLASKAPAATLPGLYAQHAKPSSADLAKWNRYRDVAVRPMRALEHAKRGTLTREHVESLQAVWPALYRHIQERFLDVLMDNAGKTMSPHARMMLAMLTGFNLDGALGFNSIAANQAVYVQQSQRSGQDAMAGNPSADKLKLGDRAKTPMQRLDGRLGE